MTDRSNLYKIGTVFGLSGLAAFLPLSIAGAHIFLGISLLVWLIVFRRSSFVPSSIDRPILSYLGVAFVAGLAGLDPTKSLLQLAAYWHIAIYLLVVNLVLDLKLIQRLLLTLIGAATLAAVYGIAQHGLGGLDLFRTQEEAVILTVGDQVRASGFFSHFMTFAGQMMMVSLMAVAVALWDQDRVRRAILFSCSAVMSLALLFSFTRSAWIGLGAGLLVVASMRGRAAIALLGVGAVATVIILLLVSPALRDRLISIGDTTSNQSNLERIRTWKTTADMIRANPWLGVGDGNYRTAMEEFRQTHGALSHSHPHNAILAQWATKGVFGLVAYLVVWFAFYRSTLRAIGRSVGFEKGLLVGSISAVTAFHVAGLFEANFGDSEVAMMMWFVVGLGFWAAASADSTMKEAA